MFTGWIGALSVPTKYLSIIGVYSRDTVILQGLIPVIALKKYFAGI